MAPKKRVESGAGAGAGAGDVSVASASGAAAGDQSTTVFDTSVTAQMNTGEGIDQFELARSQVQKAAKGGLPASVQLRKEVLLALMKASTVFISYTTAAAREVAEAEGRKNFNPSDILRVLSSPEMTTFHHNRTVVADLRKDFEAASRKTKQAREEAKAKRAKAGEEARLGSSGLAQVGEEERSRMEVDGDEAGAAAAEEAEEAAEGSVEEEENDDNEEQEGDDDEDEEEIRKALPIDAGRAITNTASPNASDRQVLRSFTLSCGGARRCIPTNTPRKLKIMDRIASARILEVG
ncbi:DNA polymerase epsilon, subunit D [Ceraceosorus bombacis]|uniref:DNA polymerase epsilon subunit D n=1 Tax=Ceraceosorus bombacis TaxID=401625 RepID=A0A0N7LBD6_9BASI|nr:DNA polymerase epsilon, subunit D [Ceraceosorus bombacis]